jgi:uncharacterized phiE125 gp8 family phage protein
MNVKQTVAPTTEPLAWEEVQEHLGITDSDWGGKIANELIPGAREMVEQDTGRAIGTQTWKLRLDAWPKGDTIHLPFPPLQSVTSITYKLADGVTTTTLAATVYDVDIDSEPGRIYLRYCEQWPTDALYPHAAITITFVAGYDTGTGLVPLPVTLKQAMLLQVGNRFANREAAVVGGSAIVTSGAIAEGYDRLIGSKRVHMPEQGK